MIWIQFIACTAVIVFAGSKVSKYGDIIAEKTGMGKTWIGVLLLATVTSLPELITGASSVAIFNVPDIAVGDVLGSCAFNLLLIALLDGLAGPEPVVTKVKPGQVLTAAFGTLMLGMVCLSLALGTKVPRIGWVGINSILFLLIYVIAMRLIFLYEKKRAAEFFEEVFETHPETMTLRQAYFRYAMFALLIVSAATWLPHLGEQIAQITGLERSFVGSIFIAISTSLPEMVVSVAALRIGAVDLAFGNVLGSNLFNIAILALDDVMYKPGPLLTVISGSHLITAIAAIVMTAITVIGLTYKTNRKYMFLSADAWGILLIWLTATFYLYILG